MKTIACYVNTFVERRSASQIILPLTIVEGPVLNFNAHFRFKFGEFLQTHEETYIHMVLRTVDVIAMDPSSNLHVGIRYFILVTSEVLQGD